MTENKETSEHFKIMERKLYWGITTPGAIITMALGLWMITILGPSVLDTTWLRAKLALVALLVVYHIWCGKLLLDFKHDRNKHSHVWYRWFNEIPVLVMMAIVILVVVKPF